MKNSDRFHHSVDRPGADRLCNHQNCLMKNINRQSAGDVLPVIELPVPQDGRLQEYLGVSAVRVFFR